MEQIIENQTHAPVSNQIKKVICGFVNKNFKVFKKWELLDVKMFRDIFTSEISDYTKEDIEETGVSLSILEAVKSDWNTPPGNKNLLSFTSANYCT